MHVVLAGDLLDADNALMAGLVRKPWRACKVADGIHARFAGAAVFVDHHVPAIDLHAGAFKAEIFHVANDTDGRDHAIHRDVLALAAGLDGDGDVVLALLRAFYGGADQDADALLLERLVGEGRNFLVLDWKNPRQDFHNRHLGAHVAIEAGELDADGAGADHQQGLWHRGWDHRLLVGPDQLAVRLDAGKLPCARTGCQDDMWRLQCRNRLAILLHRDGLLAGKFRTAAEHGDLVLAQQERDAL